MPARYRFHRFFKGSRTGTVRLVIVDLLLFWIGAAGFYLWDTVMNPFPQFFFNVWAGFVTGMMLLILFNILVEFLGTGYDEWRAQQAARRPSGR
ncbi:MAG: hypothetical protein Q7T26_12600 [Dehalococcoidia bacterium]|nr:hypothetical protein [Dehalococcoidia bacterium]